MRVGHQNCWNFHWDQTCRRFRKDLAGEGAVPDVERELHNHPKKASQLFPWQNCSTTRHVPMGKRTKGHNSLIDNGQLSLQQVKRMKSIIQTKTNLWDIRIQDTDKNTTERNLNWLVPPRWKVFMVIKLILVWTVCCLSKNTVCWNAMSFPEKCKPTLLTSLASHPLNTMKNKYNIVNYLSRWTRNSWTCLPGLTRPLTSHNPIALWITGNNLVIVRLTKIKVTHNVTQTADKEQFGSKWVFR